MRERRRREKREEERKIIETEMGAVQSEKNSFEGMRRKAGELEREGKEVSDILGVIKTICGSKTLFCG
jgi:hypothetical protein